MQSISVLGLVMDIDSKSPEVIPSKHGGIRLEWHQGDRDLEITIVGDSVIVFFADDLSNDTWEGDLMQLLGPTRQALATFTL